MFPGSFLLAMPVNAVTQAVPGRTRLHGSSPAQPGGDKCPKAPTPWGPGPQGELGVPVPMWQDSGVVGCGPAANCCVFSSGGKKSLKKLCLNGVMKISATDPEVLNNSLMQGHS